MAGAIYTTDATSSGGGRDGKVSTPDGILDQDLTMPPALGGPGGATNPEQLFAAAYATCFQSQADEIVAGAHQVCPYSKATRGNVDVALKATV